MSKKQVNRAVTNSRCLQWQRCAFYIAYSLFCVGLDTWLDKNPHETHTSQSRGTFFHPYGFTFIQACLLSINNIQCTRWTGVLMFTSTCPCPLKMSTWSQLFWWRANPSEAKHRRSLTHHYFYYRCWIVYWIVSSSLTLITWPWSSYLQDVEHCAVGLSANSSNHRRCSYGGRFPLTSCLGCEARMLYCRVPRFRSCKCSESDILCHLTSNWLISNWADNV